MKNHGHTAPLKSKLLQLTFLLIGLTMVQAQYYSNESIPVKESMVYSSLTQGPKSYNYYEFNQTGGNHSSQNQYLVIRVDVEDASSDPDVYISASNPFPQTEDESDQYCVKYGSDLCFIREDLLMIGEPLYFTVRCIDDCTYTLRVFYTPVIQLSSTTKLQTRLDSHTSYVFQAYIPQNASDGPTTSFTFDASSYSIQTPIKLYFTGFNDLSLIEEKDIDVVSQNGKSLTVTPSTYGFCTGCYVYFIVSVRVGSTYTISTKSSSGKGLIQNQIPFSRTLNANQQECYFYQPDSLVNDVVFDVQSYQGDYDLAVKFLNTSNQTNGSVIILPDTYSQSQIIIRTADRQRFGGTNTGFLNFCVNTYADSSYQIQSTSFYSMNRFDVTDDTLQQFTLDTKDYIYFRYTSLDLMQSQNISINLNSYVNTTALPKILYKLCQSSNPNDCYLTDNDIYMYGATGSQSTLIMATQTLTSTQSKTAFINHSPLNCAMPSSCYYLIAVYNSETSGPIRNSLKITLQQQSPTPIALFQEYSDVLMPGDHQYFSVQISPDQLNFYNISTMVFTLTVFNGQAELYFSTSNPNPNMQSGYDQVCRQWQFIDQITYDVSKMNLNQNTTMYLGINAISKSQYMLTVNAQYTSNYPKNMYSNTTLVTNSTTVIYVPTTQNTSGFHFVQFNKPQQFVLKANTSTVQTVFVQPKYCDRALVFSPQLLYIDPYAAFTYDVTYGNWSWIGNTDTLIIQPNDTLLYDTASLFMVTFRGNFNITPANITLSSTQNLRHLLYDSKQLGKATAPKPSPTPTPTPSTKNTTVVAVIPPNITINFTTYSVNVQPQSPILIDTDVNHTYSGFFNTSGGMSIYRQVLLDTNGTYIFSMTNQVGLPYMMEKNGIKPGETLAFNINETDTFDYASTVFDVNDVQSITMDANARYHGNIRCQNSSYALLGGNDNCTMYVAVYCTGQCVYNFTVTYVSASKQSNGVIMPTLINPSSIITKSIAQGQVQTYYMPYVKYGQADLTLVLNRQFGDSILAVKLISNAYLPFYSWTMPSNTTYDFISRNNSQYSEVIDLSNATLSSKCGNNNSCAILVSVIGNQQTKNLTNYTLQFLPQSNKLGNITVVNSTIVNANSYDYYWFEINSSGSKASPWSYFITASTNNTDQDIDLYATVINVRLPTSTNYDYSGTLLGPDLINITSADSLFAKSSPQKIIVMVGVKSNQPNTSYTLMSYGPQPYDQNALVMTDLTLNGLTNITLPTKSVKPTSNYKMFRYFNYGVRDVQFNFTVTSGSVGILASYQPFRSEDQDLYLNIPLLNQTSKMAPLNLTKGQSQQVIVSKSSNQYLWCQFCWYYIAVFQTSSTLNSTFAINVTEVQDGGQFVPVLNAGDNQTLQSIINSTVFQRKFILHSKDQSYITIQSTNSASFNVYIGIYTDYINNPTMLQLQGQGSLVIPIQSSNYTFEAGTYYYVTVLSNAPDTNLYLSLSQQKSVKLLRDQQLHIAKMWTSEDFVKYYYIIPPKTTANYTAQLTINSKTPGFMPNIYIQKNDVINGSFNFSNLVYPNIANYTSQFESPLYQLQNQTSTAIFNVYTLTQNTTVFYNVTVNTTVNTSTKVNTTTNSSTKTNSTTKTNTTNTTTVNTTTIVSTNVTKNYTVTNTIQQYYTIAVYMNSYGYSEFEKAQFEIEYQVLPLQKQQKLSTNVQDVKDTQTQPIKTKKWKKQRQQSYYEKAIEFINNLY